MKRKEMGELAKFIFENTGSLILNKKQTAKLLNKSVAFIDAAIHKNSLDKIPRFTKKSGVEFTVMDVAEFIERMNEQVA